LIVFFLAKRTSLATKTTCLYRSTLYTLQSFSTSSHRVDVVKRPDIYTFLNQLDASCQLRLAKGYNFQKQIAAVLEKMIVINEMPNEFIAINH